MPYLPKLLGNWHSLEADTSAEAFVDAESNPRFIQALSKDGHSTSYSSAMLQGEPILTSCKKKPLGQSALQGHQKHNLGEIGER